MRVNCHFREEQRFRQPWLLAILILPFIPLVLSRSWGNPPVPDVGFMLSIVFPGAFLLWFLNLKLVTEVRDDELYVKFEFLWRARRIPLSRIRSAAAVNYNPLLDYGGWGIRCGRKGMAYNVSGNRGVLLELDEGRPVLVGSQRAEELARAVEIRRTLFVVE